MSLVSVTIVHAVDYKGGTWTYGGHHEVGNWGPFSNFYHETQYHSSSVVSEADSTSDYAEAAAKYTSKAFINTYIGEPVKFNASVY